MISPRNIFQAYSEYVHYNVSITSTQQRLLIMSVMAERYVFDSLRHITSPNYGGIEFTDQKIRQIVNVLKNPALSSLTISIFTTHYSKYKRIYNAFVRLSRIWKTKKYPIQVSNDLFLSPLSVSDTGTYILLQNKCQYYFSLRDLARTVVESITHSQGLFSLPLVIKNPYTNIPFSKTELFNIFLTMKERCLPIPLAFWRFFQYEFNIFEFRRRMEPELRSMAINNYVSTAPHMELYPDLCDMLFHHNVHTAIRPGREFSVRQWIDDMRPFLKLFFNELYSHNMNERINAHNELQYKLQLFAIKNRNYGRQTDVSTNRGSEPITITNYLQNHIYNDLQYNTYINPSIPVFAEQKTEDFSDVEEEGDENSEDAGGNNEGGNNEDENSEDEEDDYEDGRWESPL